MKIFTTHNEEVSMIQKGTDSELKKKKILGLYEKDI